ncbi:polysaccharide pyruvyl transferase family protein [Thiomicrorhabdus sediminis]|uniref:Polysaccharide pyruvyl transferase family protein n=1 Tax=Thiomicrorhabdus sediminis TaxID=2580412 RepID=A0A4P9K3P5_9GAMM|nr:polysaccharide pyruvyl transferase family protein [Thiomicrorhabdus sediminis]QCU89544.1 polysaccharide pyruvyl transferase family protein [Thiomicrorhabdus sediminis]
MKITVINHCSHNKGDNSVLFFLLKLIEKKFNCEVVVSISGERPFWLDNNVETVPWGRRGLFSNAKIFNLISKFVIKFQNVVLLPLILKALSNQLFTKAAKNLFTYIFNDDFKKAIETSDLIISTGGHHISTVLDSGGMNQQFLDMMYVNLRGKSMVLWSQSVGPLSDVNKDFKVLFGRMIRDCKYVFARGESSIEWVKQYSSFVGKSVFLVNDTVFSANHFINAKTDFSEEKYVVLCVYTADNKSLDRNCEIYKSIIRKVIQKYGCRVKIIPMQYKGMSGDERAFIMNMLKALPGAIVNQVDVLVEDKNPVETLRIFSKSFCVVTHKTHPMIYGLTMKVPVISISYHEKFFEVMNDYGLQDYIIEPDKYTETDFDRLFSDIEKNRILLVDKITNKTDEIAQGVVDSFMGIENSLL